ncbi:hypothetical protein [Spirosoma sp. KNUC1025]|uniref:hypothetical protein n=1 Tax=Spirosoma sp. KNUC1025 TaxID=2894082 RepID=UPI0038681086|nr:hypothetical protein LN737_17810 [Spirosoma sp. KNUC1025]
MKKILILLPLLFSGIVASAQTKPVPPTPASVVSVIEGVTGKRFVPDTTFAALSEEDQSLLAKQPLANWGLLQESSDNMAFSNLVIGTRSYQLVVRRLPKSSHPMAMLVRYTTPESKPETIARGTLQPKAEEKPK